MECKNCGAWMRRIIEPNGKTYWHCGVCGYTEETRELAPPFFNNAQEYDTIKENGN